MDLFRKFYDSIELNLGIKALIKSTKRNLDYFISNNLLLPGYYLINGLIFKKGVFHYGAAYKIDDQRSQNIDKKSRNYGYGQIHYSFIKNNRIERALCAGSMYGYIPYMMAKACMENGKGVVDFVDAGYDINKKKERGRHNYGVGFWRKVDLKKHFSYLLDEKRIKIHVMTTKEFVEKYDEYKYDYICLDSDHSYDGAKNDYSYFWPRLKEMGFLCFHDIHLKTKMDGVEFGYWKLWKELTKKHEFKFELYNSYSGLGFIQKITKPRKLSNRKL